MPAGIRMYRLYLNGRVIKTVKDKDGPGGKDPRPRTKFRLRGGKHRWYVRAWDYAGNKRTSRAFAGSKSRKSSVLYVEQRGPGGKRAARQGAPARKGRGEGEGPEQLGGCAR